MLRDLLRFVATVAVVGIFAHVFGEALPRQRFRWDRFPWRSFSWEQDGRIYSKLTIERWKDRLPDKSKVVKSTVRKAVGADRSAEHLLQLITETCVAEFTHWTLILASPLILCFDRPWTVWMMLVSMLLFNLPFVLIQRYNRPQLVKLASRLRAREERLKQ